jgi:hypothetical protein
MQNTEMFDDEWRRSVDTLTVQVRQAVAGELAAAGENLAAAVRTIDAGRSLTAILDALIACAAAAAPRVAVLLIRGDRLEVWRWAGFDSSLDASTFDLPLADAGYLAEAVRSGASVSPRPDVNGETGFAGVPSRGDAVASPMSIGGQVVAVLYADHQQGHGGVGRCRPGWCHAIDVMARHAARCLEAQTAFQAARASSVRPPAVRFTSAVRPQGGGAREEVAGDAARRYARLLVSEIKLYHEADVVAGRRARDLAIRLQTEIARARALYEQRIGAAGRPDTDYFAAELVRTLANGDAASLGVAG